MDETKPLRILVTASTFPRHNHDSCPRFVLDVCKSLQEVGGSQCLVLAPHESGARTSEVMEGVSVRRYRYFFPGSLQKISGLGIVSKIKKNKLLALLVPFFLFFQFIATVRAIRDYRPDVLLVNWIVPQGLVAVWAKMFFPGLKMVLISHGGDVALIRKNALFGKIGAWVLKRADKVVGVSSFGQREMARISRLSEGEIEVLSMGVNENDYRECRLNRKKNLRALKKCLLFIGRIEEKKGLLYLLEAMPRILKKHPDVVLKIIGTGTLKDKMEDLSRRLNLEGSVEFLGAVDHDQIPRYFEEVMVFVVPSVDLDEDIEGLPTVIPETIAATVPVIATDAGGITDIIEDNVTGVLVEQRNSFELADKIIQLMEDENRRKLLVANAFSRLLENYTYTAIGRRCREILDSLTLQAAARRL